MLHSAVFAAGFPPPVVLPAAALAPFAPLVLVVAPLPVGALTPVLPAGVVGRSNNDTFSQLREVCAGQLLRSVLPVTPYYPLTSCYTESRRQFVKDVEVTTVAGPNCMVQVDGPDQDATFTHCTHCGGNHPGSECRLKHKKCNYCGLIVVMTVASL